MGELRYGSLCSGYGGLELGVQSVLGGSTAWVSDIDKGANKILAHRYAGVPNLGDFTGTDWSTVEPVDVLTAGFPCQPVSHAGKRQGDLDERWLWDDVARAVRDLRPRLVVLENVRGLLTAGSGRLFGRVLGALADLGYDASWHGLRAADVGAAHGRWRVFIVATDARDQRHEWAGSAWDGWAGPANRGLLPTPTARDWKNVGDPAKTAGRMAERGQPLSEVVVNTLLPTPAVNDMGDRPWANPETWDAWTEKHRERGINGNGHGKSLAIEAQRLLPTPMVGDAASACNSTATRHKVPPTGVHAGDTLTDVIRGSQAWGQYAAVIARWEHVLGRPAPAPTMTSTKGNPQLSPRFVEFLMGLPEGWVTDVPGITRNEALKALGNGVVAQQCAAAVRFLLGATEAVA